MTFPKEKLYFGCRAQQHNTNKGTKMMNTTTAVGFQVGQLIAIDCQMLAADCWVRVAAVTDKAVKIAFTETHRTISCDKRCQQWIPKSALRWTGNSSFPGCGYESPEHFDIAQWMIRKLENWQIRLMFPTINQSDLNGNWRQ